MDIHLTKDAAKLGSRLRKTFMSGDRGKRYTPQNKTPFSGLIIDFDANPTYDRPVIEPPPAPLRFSNNIYRLPDESPFHQILQRIGRGFGLTVPNKSDEQDYRKFLELAVEKVVAYYRPDLRWLEARRAVKEHIVKDSFRKAKETIAIDVPKALWGKFATKAGGHNQDKILEFLDRHLTAHFERHHDKLDILVRSMAAATSEAELHMLTCEPQFVVLKVGESIKRELSDLIRTDFEPFLVALLSEKP